MQNYPVHELSSFLFFIFPMFILVILYIRMGLRIRQTSGIQRNLPRASFHGHHAVGGGGQQQQTQPQQQQQQPQQQQQQPPSEIEQQQQQQQLPESLANGGSFRGAATERHISGARRAILRMLGESWMCNFQGIFFLFLHV